MFCIYVLTFAYDFLSHAQNAILLAIQLYHVLVWEVIQNWILF